MTTHKPTLSNGILDSKGRQVPLALVTGWSSDSLRVICPYCLRCHRHGLGPSPLTGQTRLAHCALGDYQLCYPFEEQTRAQYSYRIDKAKGLFVTVGVALPNDDEDESDSDDDDGEGEEAEEDNRYFRRLQLQAERDDTNRDPLQTLRDQVEQLDISDAETRGPPSFDKMLEELMQDLEELMQDTCYRQIVFDSHCINNDLRKVASLLETYKDDPFVSRRNKGVNCVALAAVGGHEKMIQFLHTKGGDLNNADNRGRTPLMEAALWGRLNAVDFLLEHGADPRAKDRKGRGAYFYSRPSRRTARMREKFSRYPESSEAGTNRRIIAAKLQAFEPVTTTEETASSSSSNVPKPGHFVRETTDRGIQIGFYEQSIAYNVPDLGKTVARLDRGRLFPVISAASGWRTDFAVEHVIDNRLWRDQVFELCQLIGHALPEHGHDEPRRPGSFNASHAEKKLIAYYISQHVILPSVLFGAGAVDQPEKWVQQDLRLQHLATLCPRVPTVQASIRVSRAICSDCKLFISHIRTVLGVSFTVEHC